ncbi:MAG TPA: MaoC/PaaZ C-terminal domain-containing protein [Enteractinococcus sp.]
MTTRPYVPGTVTRFRKTITETDMVLFAGITGDFAANHTDEEYMRDTPFGTRHVHGALVAGFMSTVAAKALEDARPEGLVPVSAGYDKMRFLESVFPGDTLELVYEFNDDFDPDRLRATASVRAEVAGKTVAVATHVVTWVRAPKPALTASEPGV